MDVDVDVNVDVDVDVGQDEAEYGQQDLQLDFDWHLDGLARLFAQQNSSWLLPIFYCFQRLVLWPAKGFSMLSTAAPRTFITSCVRFLSAWKLLLLT